MPVFRFLVSSTEHPAVDFTVSGSGAIAIIEGAKTDDFDIKLRQALMKKDGNPEERLARMTTALQEHGWSIVESKIQPSPSSD